MGMRLVRISVNKSSSSFVRVGLLGLAVDPNYVSNHYLYFLYSVDPDTNGVDTSPSDNFGLKVVGSHVITRVSSRLWLCLL